MNNNQPLDTVPTRDDRFKEILKKQLGENGAQMLVVQSVLFVMALIMIVTIVIGAMALTLLNSSRGESSNGNYNSSSINNNNKINDVVSLRRAPIVL